MTMFEEESLTTLNTDVNRRLVGKMSIIFLAVET